MTRTPSDAARFAAAGAAGGAPALLVHAWFAMEGTSHLLAPVVNAQFYEVQARSLLHGRWDIPAGSIGAERFLVDGRFYEYFGPWPAVLRLPVVAVTDRFDGRLSRIAVLAAIVVFLAAVTHLVWQARAVTGGDSTVTTADLAAVCGFVFVAACGTVLVFLSGWTAVYHEAIIWGVAWAVASSTLLVAYLRSGRSLHLLGAGAAAALCLLSRGSVGLGPAAALALVLVARLVGLARRRPASGRGLLVLAATVVIPLALYAYVNWARFGSLTGVPPTDKQDLLTSWPGRAEAMAANGGSLFGPRYAPTILLQYLRPDALGFDRLFPWVGFSSPPLVVGGSVFEALNPSASITAASPLFVLLACGGVVFVLRRRLLVFAAPLMGAGIGGIGVLSLAFVDQRYQGDFVPLLVVGAAACWWPLMRMASHRRALVTAVAVLAGWSCWTNGALAYQYQRGWSIGATTATRAGMVRTQLAVHGWLANRPPSRVGRGEVAGPPGRPHSLFVQGRCAAVLWSDGREWHPVEVTNTTGRFAVRARPQGTARGHQPIVSVADSTGTSVLWLLDDGRLEYGWWPAGGGRPTIVGERRRPSAPLDLEVHLDRSGIFASRVTITSRGATLLDAAVPVAIGAPVSGAQGVAPTRAPSFDGDITILDTPTPICDRLRAHGAGR